MLFIILTIGVFILSVYTFNQILFKGRWEYIVFFAALFFPVYITLISVVFSTTGSVQVLGVFQYLKEIMIFLAIICFFAYHRDFSSHPFRLGFIDYLFLGFYLLAFIFLLLPIGEATFLNKALYFKNIVLMGIFFFFGRNTHFDLKESQNIFNVILFVGLMAFGLNLFEFLTNTHFQQHTGYSIFNEKINEIYPTGNYGLTWTFETQTTGKRFASFFSDPLELAISSLLIFSTALIMFLTTKREDAGKYLLLVFISFCILMFSSSRSSLVAWFVMCLYIAFVFRLYNIIFAVGVLTFGFAGYFIFFATEEFQYFIIDTVTFQNSSSLGHVVEWLAAIESIIQNPQGIGLAMSGNVGSVDEELRIGGENQFLVFGVQLGVLGMFLYILILIASIIYCYKAFFMLKNLNEARIAFIASTVKFGCLLPLFTSNAEKFLFVSLLTWWMVGYTVNAMHRVKLNAIRHV
ncbi:O-antigen ligase family protein [Belliella marina]|uniref:O-antigen ligase family protein n=1 Tax=Belliella marina TaxID=1644146 RepID=A0ABW4VNQ3_9BACT